MYEWTEAFLAQAGWRHYEISNWAKPGYACQHNLVYWRNQDYVGLGAGAHSHLGGRRWSNLSDPDDYLDRVERGQLPSVDQEALSAAQVMGETMMLGLRLVEGVSGAEFERRFGLSIERVYGPLLAELQGAGLIESKAGRVRLTGRGRLLGNQVFCRFI
jgi:oxygen-independent coproporphyrinogen-3 oxidase